jgi:LSD1 subclass zinc finger protein
VLAFAPVIQNVTVLGAAVLTRMGLINTGIEPRSLLGWWLAAPAAPILALACGTTYFTALRPQVPSLRVALAAVGEGHPGCRRCGAPLTLGEGAVFVRCAHCRTDNLVTVDALRERALLSETSAVASSAETALAALRQDDKIARTVLWATLALCVAVGLAAELDFQSVIDPADYRSLPLIALACTCQLVAPFFFVFPLTARGAHIHRWGRWICIVYAIAMFPLLAAWATEEGQGSPQSSDRQPRDHRPSLDLPRAR